MHNAEICGTFDTWFISSTYWDELTIQQRVLHWRSGWGVILWGVWGVNLDIWPPIIQQVQASCPNRSAFSPKNTSSICWISPHISFSMIAWGTSIHRRVRGDTDPCYDAHPYLKGVQVTCGWPLSGTLGLSCTRRILHNTFVGYFLKLQQYDIMHNELRGFNLGGTQMTRATAAQKLVSVKSNLLMNV